MKRCPECRRDYYDDSLLYCLDDGTALLDGPASFDGPPTEILPESGTHSTSAPSVAATRAQVHVTEREPSVRAVRRTFDKRLLPAAMALAAVVLAGFGGHRYFAGRDKGEIRSVAVLPFQNRSDDADTDYLSDGLADSLIFRLSQLQGLKVSPASSVVRYKGRAADIATIATELGVDAVMTGRLMKRGENFSITVELVDARDNSSLWGEQYERKMSDLLATQREIAAAIVQKLQLKLIGSDRGVTKKYTDNNDAYQLYLKGRYHFARRSKVDMERSVELLRQATQLDPNFALAYVGIAEAYTSMPSYPYISPKEASPKARAAIEKAMQLDPDLPEAHAVAGLIATTDEWDYAKAERAFKRSIELGPNLAISHYRYGWTYLSSLGRHEEAIAEMKRAMELEPLSVQQGANYAAVLMYARRFDESIEQARKTYELDQNHIGSRNWLCHPLNAKGMYADAIALGEQTETNLGNQLSSLFGCLGAAYAATGQREKALAQIAKVKEAEKTRYVANYWLAVVYAQLGDTDMAFAELEKAYNNRDWFFQRLKVDPYMDPLRSDPRFDAMVKRLNFPQ